MASGPNILRHLSDALDEVRRSEYRRPAGKDRTFIKGQRYTLTLPPGLLTDAMLRTLHAADIAGIRAMAVHAKDVRAILKQR